MTCSGCEVLFEKEQKYIKYNETNGLKNFCSRSCFAEFKLLAEEFQCGWCGKSTIKTPSVLSRSKSGGAYCSRSCSTSANNKLYKTGKGHPSWKTGIGGYRSNALKYYGYNCTNSNCLLIKAGIVVPTELLDVHHKDSNRNNNDLTNLQVLCVYCHAIETRGLR